MERFNVVLHPLDQLSLVFTDCTADVRTHKQSIEPGEDPEHLICIFSCSKLISETCCDTSLHSVYALIVPTILHSWILERDSTLKKDYMLRCPDSEIGTKHFVVWIFQESNTQLGFPCNWLKQHQILHRKWQSNENLKNKIIWYLFLKKDFCVWYNI